MESGLLVEATGACGYFLAGLVLIVVGAVSARPVEPRAGYLAIASGGTMLLDGCCNVLPTVLWQTGSYQNMEMLSSCTSWLGLLLLLVEGGGVVGAAVLLTRATLALPEVGR